MVELREPASLRIRRWLITGLLVLVAIAVVWVMQRRNSAIGSAECSALYREARTAGDTARADRARPDVGGRDVATAVACGQLRASPVVRFGDYAVDTTFVGPTPALDFDRDTTNRRFRTVLRTGIADGPNFAGHFAIISWGCGTACRSYAIVDLSDGKVFADSALDFSCHVVNFTRASRLVVMVPSDTTMGHVCSSRDTIRLVWGGARFDPLR